ncbi:MAG: hypothetical protein ABII13_00405 [Patescibacteria group bacterium]|nr:hypothetical protein [Patescibacteria group bacterium]MBU2509561.1 hypothetical protein [Patescibacteria group bacterium]
MPPAITSSTGSFSSGELKLASFWVRNRSLFVRTGYGFLIALNVVLWAYVLWGILDAYAISYPRESRITQKIIENQIAEQSLQGDRPVNIQTTNVTVFETTDNRLDMVVDVTNSNKSWWAEFNYRFNISGEQTSLRSGFILPNSQIALTELGFKPTAPGGRAAQLIVDDIRWHRIDPAMVGASYEEYADKVFKVGFENIDFQTDLIIGTQRIGRTSFDIVNPGSYGYWNMGLVIKLYRGTRVLGVNNITLKNVAPGETRHVELDWFDQFPTVTQTEIIPVVNLLDQNNFLPTEYFR